MPSKRVLMLLAAAGLALAGCANFSPDGGTGRVAALTQERTGLAPAFQSSPDAVAAARSRSAELLRQPLTADAAVQIAFLNNRGLQASFSELGIAEANLVRAGRLPNPSIAFGHLRDGVGGVEIERAITFDVLGLLTLALAPQIEQRRFGRAQLQAASDAVALAADTRKAYYAAVASRELASYFEQVEELADAAAELALRMAGAGNFSALEQMQQQAFHVDAKAQLALARQQSIADRERLTRLLGLTGDPPGFTLPDRLPPLPTTPSESAGVEQQAMERRLDVLVARHAVADTASSLGLTKATRFVNVLDLGYRNRSDSGAARADGYAIELELPLFDFGSARLARAEAVYMQALHRAAQVATDARSEVRAAYAAYRAHYDLARHYRDEVLPLAERIAQEHLLRYNGMLIGVFDLLANSRSQIAGVAASVQALRDFWIAETDLQGAITRGSPAAAD